MDVLATVAIPTYQRPDYLLDALQSIIAQDANFAFEVLVVDNGCDSALRSRVESIAQQAAVSVRYLPVAEIGLHNARHAAARAALSEIVVYVDDDVIAPPGWLAAMIAPFAEPTVAIVGGKTVPKWEAEPPAWLAQFGVNGGAYLSMLDLGDSRLELTWPQGVYGCNMAVRRAVLEQVGGFNPDGIGDRRKIWQRGDGETGLHQKVFAAGYQVIYEPMAWLHHRVPAARLQPEYFFWRALSQGVSDSYSWVRSNRPGQLALLRAALRALRSAARCSYHARRSTEHGLALEAQMWYWWGMGQHRLHLLFSPALRQHVLRDVYL